MKFFVVLLVATATLVCGSYGLPNTRILFDKWIEFKTIFGKKYEDHEEPKRLDIFKENLARIEAHNKLYEQGKVPYKMAVNKFADMTAEEFFQHIRPVKLDREKLLTARAKNGNLHNRTLHERPLNFQSYGSVDWRSQGAVTGVKNQGSCGSCWSFSATGALEGQLALRTGRLVSLSEQNLIDCSTQYGNQACSGGWPDLAFDYVKDYGISSEQEYPYEGQFDYCRYQRGEAVLSTIRGPVDIRPGSEQDLEHAVATVGPISVAIDVTQNFQFYSSGIFYDQYCDTESLNHAVLTVGYGNQGEYSYWIVKNSWGEEWGDAGYVYMIKDYGNNCGIASAASYPSM